LFSLFLSSREQGPSSFSSSGTTTAHLAFSLLQSVALICIASWRHVATRTCQNPPKTRLLFCGCFNCYIQEYIWRERERESYKLAVLLCVTQSQQE
jgi:hypothetical protein